MENTETRIVLTGFMGVGKSTVARHLSYILQSSKVDLDDFIEEAENRSIPEILKTDGENFFRQLETKSLRKILETNSKVISLGGGAWTMEENRKIIKQSQFTSIWLESTFEHCWRNIRFSRRERPLAQSKEKAKKLFDERQKYYCLADWHFVINSGFNSYNIAKQIAEDVFSQEVM